MHVESPIGNFIDNMGGGSTKPFGMPPIFTNKNIDIVYDDKDFESKESVSVHQPISEKKDKRTRYSQGKDTVFKCVQCDSYIGVGRETKDEEDIEKVKCFKCNKVYDAVGYIRQSNNPLWQVKKGQEEYFDKSIAQYLSDKKALVAEL